MGDLTKTSQLRVRINDRPDLGDGVQEFTIGAGLTARKIIVASGPAQTGVVKRADARWRDGIASGRAFALGAPIPGRSYDDASKNALKVAQEIHKLKGDGPHEPDSPGDFAIRLIGFNKKRAQALAADDTAAIWKFERLFFETESEARLKFKDAKPRGRPPGSRPEIADAVEAVKAAADPGAAARAQAENCGPQTAKKSRADYLLKLSVRKKISGN